MSATMTSVDEGVSRIKALIPRIVEVKTSELTYAGSEKNALHLHNLKEEGRLLCLPWSKAQQFRKRTGIDPVMMERLSPELQTQCWEALMREDQDFCFKVVGEQVVAVPIQSEELPNYHNLVERLVTKVSPIGFSNIFSRRDKVGFGMVTSRTQEPPTRSGDSVHEGLYVSFNGQAQVQPYNLRLVCTNGMLSMKLQRGTSVSEENFDSVIDTVIARSTTFTEEFIHLTQNRIENSGGLIGRLSRMHILNSRQVTQIAEQLGTLGDNATEYDLVNMITAMQHDRENSLSWALAGGNSVNFLHNDHCSHCGTVD